MSFTNYQLKLEKIASIVYICPPQKQVEVMHEWAKELYEVYEEDFKRLAIAMIGNDIQEACVDYRRYKNEVLRRL